MGIATKGGCSFITTVSKRGRPNAPGPLAAFANAMAESCPHYMAACDENDPKGMECLMDWAPAVTGFDAPEEYYYPAEAEGPFAEISTCTSLLPDMTAAQAKEWYEAM